jgi:hypothetical protein
MPNIHNLTSHTKRLRIVPDGTAATTWILAAGTSAKNSGAIDTRGYSSVLIRYAMGTITSGAVTSIKAQQSDDDAATDDYTDVAGTSQTIADTDDNKVFEIEIHRPQKRYLRVALSRGTQNAVVDYVEAILYNPRFSAPTQDTTVGGTETFNTPAEGTA